MEDIIDKEYELNEGVFVLHSTLESLYDKYKYTLPKKIRNQLRQIIEDTDDLIGDNGKSLKKYDITKYDLVLKVRYKKFIPETLKKKKESN